MKKLILILLFLVSGVAFSGQSIPVTYQLFGPAHEQAALTKAYGPNFGQYAPWVFVGSCLTCSTSMFVFNLPMPSAYFARWQLIWTPNNTNTVARLVAFDDGPSNIVEIARIYSDGSMNPVAPAVDITAVFNQLVAAGVKKHIGFQISDDGVNKWTLFESRLDVNYNIP